jgi:hypothetical protein
MNYKHQTPRAGEVYGYRVPPLVTVLTITPSEVDNEGTIICIGTVTYMNHVGSKCVKTLTQFEEDYINVSKS